MSQYNEICIAALNLVRKSELEPEDIHVPGVYSLLVPASLLPAKKAAVALDVFHSKCPVAMLDDFAFYVFDPAKQIVIAQDEEHEPYTGQGIGRDLLRLSDRTPRLYTATVRKDGDVVEVVLVLADNKPQANTYAQNWFEAQYPSSREEKLRLCVTHNQR